MLSVQANTELENTAKVTNISATARVDYIQRFSKQAVLVIHEDYQLSADVGHQYIAQLPPQSNTAFVSVSAKHNDIQIRCRIVEQLFSQQAFDPEVSLAVSLINQLKAEPQKLTVVIANAHHLSLQLLHELTQLCEIAKKSDYLISVLLLSTIEAGKTVALHKDLFAKKLSILAADSGQLISIHDSSLKASGTQFLTKTASRWLMIFVALFTLGTAIIFGLTQIDIHNNVEGKKVATDTFVQLTPSSDESQVVASKTKLEAANAQDILHALSGSETERLSESVVEREENIQASTYDILNAMNNAAVSDNSIDVEVSDKDVVVVDKEQAMEEALSLGLLDNKNVLSESESNGNYYQQFTNGYAIQLGSFSQLNAVENMKKQAADISLHHYVRKQNNAESWVLTTQVYPSREAADLAKTELSQMFPSSSFWTRSVASIQSELLND